MGAGVGVRVGSANPNPNLTRYRNGIPKPAPKAGPTSFIEGASNVVTMGEAIREMSPIKPRGQPPDDAEAARNPDGEP